MRVLAKPSLNFDCSIYKAIAFAGDLLKIHDKTNSEELLLQGPSLKNFFAEGLSFGAAAQAQCCKLKSQL